LPARSNAPGVPGIPHENAGVWAYPPISLP
jgi:hypothetical protein